MPLSEAENNRNRDELLSIENKIKQKLILSSTQLEKLTGIVTTIKSEFHHKDVLLSYDEGKDALQALLEEALLDISTTKKKFKVKMHQFVDEYRIFEQVKEEEFKSLKKMMFSAPHGIKQSLQYTGEVAFDTWGNDDDIRFILKGLMVDPLDVKSGGTYILPPVMIAPGSDASEIEREDPAAFLRNHVLTVIANNPQHKIQLLVPLNISGMHWVLFGIMLDHGSIEHAVLQDSMMSKLKASEAYRYVVEAVNVDPAKKVPVTTLSTGEQKNYYSCMDYTIQSALHLFFESESAAEESGFQVIYSAKTSQALREAIVEKVQMSLLAADTVQNVKPSSVATLGLLAPKSQSVEMAEVEKAVSNSLRS